MLEQKATGQSKQDNKNNKDHDSNNTNRKDNISNRGGLEQSQQSEYFNRFRPYQIFDEDSDRQEKQKNILLQRSLSKGDKIRIQAMEKQKEISSIKQQTQMTFNKMLMGVRNRKTGRRRSFEFHKSVKQGLSDNDYNRLVNYFMKINDSLNYLVTVNQNNNKSQKQVQKIIKDNKLSLQELFQKNKNEDDVHLSINFEMLKKFMMVQYKQKWVSFVPQEKKYTLNKQYMKDIDRLLEILNESVFRKKVVHIEERKDKILDKLNRFQNDFDRFLKKNMQMIGQYNPQTQRKDIQERLVYQKEIKRFGEIVSTFGKQMGVESYQKMMGHLENVRKKFGHMSELSSQKIEMGNKIQQLVMEINQQIEKQKGLCFRSQHEEGYQLYDYDQISMKGDLL